MMGQIGTTYVRCTPSATPVVRIGGFLTDEQLAVLESIWVDAWRAYTDVIILPIAQLDLTCQNILDIPFVEFAGAFPKKYKHWASEIVEIAKREAV